MKTMYHPHFLSSLIYVDRRRCALFVIPAKGTYAALGNRRADSHLIMQDGPLSSTGQSANLCTDQSGLLS